MSNLVTVPWPELSQGGCKACPIGVDECKAFRRCTACNEAPCDVFDTYTEYIESEEDNH